MFGFFLCDNYPTDWDSAQANDVALFRRLFHSLLELGVYLAPSPFEAAFLSTAHSAQVIQDTLAAWEIALQRLQVQISDVESPVENRIS